MSKQEVVKAASNVLAMPNKEQLAKAIAASKEASPAVAGGVEFMKCATDGSITIGMDNEEVEATEQWLINPGELQLGFICWKEGKPIDTAHRNFAQLAEHGAYNEADLPDHGPYVSEMDGWSPQSVLPMVSEMDGTSTIFPTSSIGGRQAIQKIIDAVGAKNEVDSEYLCPVVTVTSDSYHNKKFRKDIYFPVFTVVGWKTASGELES